MYDTFQSCNDAKVICIKYVYDVKEIAAALNLTLIKIRVRARRFLCDI